MIPKQMVRSKIAFQSAPQQVGKLVRTFTTSKTDNDPLAVLYKKFQTMDDEMGALRDEVNQLKSFLEEQQHQQQQQQQQQNQQHRLAPQELTKASIQYEDLVSEKSQQFITLLRSALTASSRFDPPSWERFAMIFVGNPGVGKSTLARLVAETLYDNSILKFPSIVKLTTEEMGVYLENTTGNFDLLMQERCLYVDKADKAWERNGQMYLNTFLNKIQENRKGAVILSCSPDGFQKLLSRSPQLSSQFPIVLHFDDFNEIQLEKIANFVIMRHGITPTGVRLQEVIRKMSKSELKQKNGHLANEFGLQAIYDHLCHSSLDQIGTLVYKPLLTSNAVHENLSKLNDLVGLTKVKEFVESLQQMASLRDRGEVHPSQENSLHMIFIGNTGTGKRTVAKLLGNILHSFGYLSSGHCVTAQVNDFVAPYVGQTSTKSKELIESALGGVLFIEDAHLFAQARDVEALSDIALSTLSHLMEIHGKNLVVVLSGYTLEMQKLFSNNPSLKYQFPIKISFDNYSKEELFQIGLKIIQQQNYQINTNALERFRHLINVSNTDGNALSIRSMVGDIMLKQNSRVAKLTDRNAQSLIAIECDDLDNPVSKTYEEILGKLNAMVGLTKVKTFMKQLYIQTLMNLERKAKGISVSRESETLHMIFKGNPGTGKSTIALMVAEMLKGMNILKTGHLVIAKHEDFVAPYVGQTAIKTKELITSALGGVLFIDEAYHFVDTNEKDFAMIAFNTLVDMMEIHRHELVVIMSGYPKELSTLLRLNPGLKSRMPHEIIFDDYTKDELFSISKSMFEEEKYILSEKALARLKSVVWSRPISGNARGVRNMVSEIIRYQNVRLSTMNRTELTAIDMQAITHKEFEKNEHDGRDVDVSKLLGELDALVGLSGVKEFIHSLYARMTIQKDRLEREITAPNQITSLHMTFSGHPGTGKTMIANLTARLLYALKVIPTPNLVLGKSDDFLGLYVGHTGSKTRDLITSALGGVLFIDEAYHLMLDQFGKMAITTLVDMMEIHRNEFVVIMAGYPKEMESLLESNPGLMSRFTHHLEFKNYNQDELYEIGLKMFTEENYKLNDESLKKLKWAIEETATTGNARTIRNLVSKSITKHNIRVAKMENRTTEDLTTIYEQDFISEDIKDEAAKRKETLKYLL
jgi:SpoVK/Ycf46/Vps4 family AAA+-type ATPase